MRLLRAALMNLSALVLFCPCAYSTEIVAETLEEVFNQLVEEVESGSQSFACKSCKLLVYADVDGNALTPLAALLERKARLVFGRSGRFQDSLASGELPFAVVKIDDTTLSRLDRSGIDRVLDISAKLQGRALILRVRAMWLEGGSWAPILADASYYHRKLVRLALKESPEWPILARPTSELEDARPVWERSELAATKGRVLDLAAGDMDGDGVSDLLLLLAGRVEFWRGDGDGYAFRYAFALDDYLNGSALSRWDAGEIAVCDSPRRNRPRLFLATNRMRGGWAFSWNGNRFVESEPIGGAPLACLDEGILVSYYEPGTAYLKPEVAIRREGEIHPLPVDMDRALLSIMPLSDAGLVTVAPDGRAALIQNDASVDLGFKCGASPGILTSGQGALLICSAAEVSPGKDGLVTWRLEGGLAKPESELPGSAGEIYAVCAEKTLGFENIYAARYKPGGDETTIERYRR